jgi:hypothetical protein
MMLDALAAFVSLTIPTRGEEGGCGAGRFCAPPLSRSAGEGPGVRAGPSRNDCVGTVRARCDGWVFDQVLDVQHRPNPTTFSRPTEPGSVWGLLPTLLSRQVSYRQGRCLCDAYC